MHTPEDMTPAQKELEMALRSLRPDAAGVDEVGLAFRLGEAAGVRRLRRWQGSAVVCGLAAMVSIGMAIPWRNGGAPVAGNDDVMIADAAEDAADDAYSQRGEPPSPAFSMRGLYLTSSYMRQRERSLQTGWGEEGGTVPTSAVRSERAAGRSKDAEEQSSFDLFIQALTAGRKM